MAVPVWLASISRVRPNGGTAYSRARLERRAAAGRRARRLRELVGPAVGESDATSACFIAMNITLCLHRVCAAEVLILDV
jgi:hypothetical protein